MSEQYSTAAYAFFSHTACEFFPCHPTEDPDNFNCLFCFCPLYTLGSACGGRYRYTADGMKNCEDCMLPHQRDQYGQIIKKLGALLNRNYD